MLQLILQGVIGLVTFVVLYVGGRVVLHRDGGDDIKDIGMD